MIFQLLSPFIYDGAAMAGNRMDKADETPSSSGMHSLDVVKG